MRRTEQKRAFILALIAIAAGAAAAACGSSGTRTQPVRTQPVITKPAPKAAAQEFVSKRYDFRLTLTRDWTAQDAQADWDGEMLEGIGSPAYANFTDPATGRSLEVGAAPVAKDTQLAEWRAAMVRAAPSVCSESSSAEKTTLGGEPALAWTATCTDGYDVNKLAALHGKRGYMIFLPSNAANDDAKDKGIFESIRRSFMFTR